MKTQTSDMETWRLGDWLDILVCSIALFAHTDSLDHFADHFATSDASIRPRH